MRKLFLCVTLIAAFAAAGPAAQDRQRPPDIFRERVDLITIDVAAVDSEGRPVEDLRPQDFTVKVDGRARPVVSAEFIKVDPARPPTPVSPADALITTNAANPDGRRVVLAVDQTLIAPGSIVPLTRTASGFVDRLTAADAAAFIGFPEPGPRVDLTTDKARVRKALEEIVGQPAKRGGREFNIALWEALALTNGVERNQAGFLPEIPPGMPLEAALQLLTMPPTMRRVLERGCDGLTFDELMDPRTVDVLEILKRCRARVFQESVIISTDARQDAQISLRALEGLLKDLALVDGPKTMVVVSAGLVNDDPSVLAEVAELAAAARTSISVIAVDRERDQEVRSFGASQAGGTLIDRSFEMQGLEIIADSTGGTLHRSVGGTSEGVFQRIESEMSAWYLVAVERQAGDPDRQRLEVEVKRRGVTVRSSKTFLATAALNARRPMEEVLRDALSSSMSVSGIPLRVSTFTQRDAASGKYRLRLAAQVGQPGAAAGDFAVGYALMDEKGRVVTSAGTKRALAPPPKAINQPLHYDTVISVEPGVYALRFGVVDAEGRRGTVVHRVELATFPEHEVASSDLIVGNLPAEGETLSPRVEPQVTTGELAGYLELYLTEADFDRMTVSLEIAEGEASPALASEPLTLRPGEQPAWRVATGYVDAAMAPGRYVARAIIRRDGEVVRTLSRPVTVVRDPSVVVKAPPRTRGVPISPDLLRRTATYVTGVVGGLGNVVAQEEFSLSGPDRKVTSDLLLVRYPGTLRDLISYRDVAQVDGKPVPGREQRLLDLFVTPTDGLRERARQIMISADAFVPSAFNPMFVIGFLQPDFQARFEMTVSDAGTDWPAEVKAVTFVETGRPTLLRTGTFGDIDVPTRGRAWIEEGTGRILQTELELGRGRSAPTMVTRFRLDGRLQVTVPVEMRTQNPDGIATYTNFRQFGVATAAAIPAPDAQR